MEQTIQMRQGRKVVDVVFNVVAQMAFNDGHTDIRISRVSDEGVIKYVLEKNGKGVMVTESFIRKGYPWAIALLPLSKLTEKQSLVLRSVLLTEVDGDLEDVHWNVNQFKALVREHLQMTDKVIEGILSSLWVKGYILMAEVSHSGERYFTIDAFGIEYLKSADAPEKVEVAEEEEENA